MSAHTLTERVKEIERSADRGSLWERRLLALTRGDADSAARLDLTIDGNLWWADLRRRPFAGNPELRRLFQAARDAQNALRDHLLSVVWQQQIEIEEPDDA